MDAAVVTVPAAGVIDVLYSSIVEIGREKIKVQVTSDIRSPEKICRMIFEKCLAMIGHEADKEDHNEEEEEEETLTKLCEALLHFMLTTCLLPSGKRPVQTVLNLTW